MIESRSERAIAEALVPSSRLVRAALSGLFALGAGACSDDTSSISSEEQGQEHEHDAELSETEVDALCKSMVEKGVDKALADQDVEALCSDMVADSKKEAENATSKPDESELPKLCESMISSARSELESDMTGLKDEIKKLKDENAALKEKGRALLLTTEEKTQSAEQKEYTFADLTKMCDERGGYTQVHAACGGHNSCAGFSYGDWGPGAAMLTEHSCTGVNGCLGLSCVVLPKDEGRPGKELYEKSEFAEPLNNCGGCHGGYADASGKWTHDDGYFAVYVYEGSTRTADNWLDRSAAEQERVTAFGAHAVLADGTAVENMAGYHGALSRAETQRVVEHIRTLKPYMYKIKTKDPAPASTSSE